MDVYLQSFLTLALDRGEWSDTQPGRFTSGESMYSKYYETDITRVIVLYYSF